MSTSIHLNRELSDRELQSVNGGGYVFIVEPEAPGGRYVYIHNTCGGKIENVNNPFKCCRCSKCGEEHYTCFSFDYTEIEKRIQFPKS